MAPPVVNVSFDIPDHWLRAIARSATDFDGVPDVGDEARFAHAFISAAWDRGLVEGQDFKITGHDVLDDLDSSVWMLFSSDSTPDVEIGWPSELDYNETEYLTMLVNELARYIGSFPDEDEIRIERNNDPNEEQLQLYGQGLEKLMSVASNLVHDEAWKSDPFAEREVLDTLQSLTAENGRPEGPNRYVLEVYANRLSRHVVEHEQAQATAEQRAALESLKTEVLDVLDSLDGSAGDGKKVRPAVEALARHFTWSNIPAPDEVETNKWADFVEYAEAHPVETLETAFGWRHRADYAIQQTKAEYFPIKLGDGASLTSALTDGGASKAALVVFGMLFKTFIAHFRNAKPPESDD